MNIATEENRFYLTKRYVVALTIIAFLSILAFINMSYLINRQSNDGKVINISVQQIMISQKMALNAIYYQTGELLKSIEEMKENHAFLTSQQMSKELSNIYFSEPMNIDKKVREYIENAKKFRLTTDGKSLTYVLRNAQLLLDELNKVAKIYLKEAEQKTKNLKNLEIIICIATLFTLILEALFIFKPANNAINKKTKELIDVKNYLNTVIESSLNGIIALNEKCEIKTFNKKATEIFGFQKNEIKETDDLLRLIPLKYKAVHKKGLMHFFTKVFLRVENKTYEVTATNKNNEDFPIRVSFGLGALKQPIYIINIEDISEEKTKNMVLHKQAKFAALGEMIAIIAHQWRQPLAELSLNNMYLKKKIQQRDLDDELKKNENIVMFMSETITNFETFYRGNDSIWFNPNESISQALNIIEFILKLKEISLHIDNDENLKIFGERNSLSQVILSLLQNSIDKHNSNPHEESKWIKLSLLNVENNVVFSIEDNAGGIRAKNILSIFEPSSHVNKKSSSTGLGLYMSKLIIKEKFNGKIVASNTKDGALFIVTLPI